MAINGYTVTRRHPRGHHRRQRAHHHSATDLKLHLGYVTADNRRAVRHGRKRFVSHLKRSLDLYTNR